MWSVFKNLVLMFVGSLLGAGTIVVFTTLQPAIPDRTPAVAAAVQPAPAAPVAPTGETVVMDIYQRMRPAVVSVTNQRTTTSSGGAESRFTESGIGSGVILDDQGHILTNNHVVDGADALEVTLADGTRVPAKLLGRDLRNDLAVVQMEMNDSLRSRITVAPLGDSEKVMPGQLTVAIGSPFGFQGSVTSGIVSSVGRTYSTDGAHRIRNMIQTDAALNPGNSGGPLLNSAGEVIGINTAIESPVQGFVGLGFAVPINSARLSLSAMLAGRNIAPPWLGISGVTVTEELAQMLGLSVPSGVYVVHVGPESPAERAAVQGAAVNRSGRGRSANRMPAGGDVITAVDGRAVVSEEEFTDRVDSKEAGDTITLSILRGIEPIDVQVVLATQPE